MRKKRSRVSLAGARFLFPRQAKTASLRHQRSQNAAWANLTS